MIFKLNHVFSPACAALLRLCPLLPVGSFAISRRKPSDSRERVPRARPGGRTRWRGRTTLAGLFLEDKKRRLVFRDLAITLDCLHSVSLFSLAAAMDVCWVLGFFLLISLLYCEASDGSGDSMRGEFSNLWVLVISIFMADSWLCI